MKRLLALAAFFLILLLPVLQWFDSSQAPWMLFEYKLPPGQWYYVLSKLFAQYAYIFFCLQLIVGMSLAQQYPWFYSINVDWHKKLALLTITVTLLHIIFFVTAAALRSGHFPFALFTPRFDSGYYAQYVSVGLLAAGLMLLIALIGVLRSLLPKNVFEYGHRIAWFVWLLAFLHSVAIGSETRGDWLWSVFYAVSAGVILLLGLIRLKHFVVVQLARHSPRLITVFKK